MKKKVGPSKVIIFLVALILLVSVIGIYSYRNYVTYQSIEVSIKKNVIEYGTANYSLKEIVSKVEGEIVSVKKTIDTSVVGKQEIVVEVEKNSVVKEVPIQVEVVDTVAPEITLKQEKLSYTQGEEINILDNINTVIDKVDGDIEYKDVSTIDESMNNYYTIEVDSDVNAVGQHAVTVIAVDKYGNTSTANYNIEVSRPVVKTLNVGPVYTNLPANGSESSLVSIAYSLIGTPYVAGGNSASGFDCSGFVQYVYAQVGKSISRSASTQIYDGVAVSYESAQPGDILSWGYGTSVTHSALYVGNGLMIHATNPKQGVILSNVDSWLRGSGTSILSVRRIL